MSDYSLLFDVAKVRQQEMVREVERTRINHNLRDSLKSTSLSKKLRALLTIKN